LDRIDKKEKLVKKYKICSMAETVTKLNKKSTVTTMVVSLFWGYTGVWSGTK
jgi:hypothetical protein